MSYISDNLLKVHEQFNKMCDLNTEQMNKKRNRTTKAIERDNENYGGTLTSQAWNSLLNGLGGMSLCVASFFISKEGIGDAIRSFLRENPYKEYRNYGLQAEGAKYNGLKDSDNNLLTKYNEEIHRVYEDYSRIIDKLNEIQRQENDIFNRAAAS